VQATSRSTNALSVARSAHHVSLVTRLKLWRFAYTQVAAPTAYAALKTFGWLGVVRTSIPAPVYPYSATVVAPSFTRYTRIALSLMLDPLS
jgi:hypothetical protein